MRLTEKSIACLRWNGKKRKIFDGGLPNFGIRIYKTGISYVVMMGKDRKMRTIGRYPSMSLKDARMKAHRALAELDPYLERKNTETAIAEFVEDSYRRCKPRTAADYKRLLEKHFPSGVLQEINRVQLLTRLSQLSHVPGEQLHVATAFKVFH